MKKKTWTGWIPKTFGVEKCIGKVVGESWYVFSNVYVLKEKEENWDPEWWPPKKVKITIEEV